MGDSILKYHFDETVDKLIVVIDIKVTGTEDKDDIIAVGICGMTHDRRQVFKYRIGLKLRTNEEIKMMNEGRLTWDVFWKQRGYDTACFNRFWIHRIDKLNMIQSEGYIKLVDSNRALAFEINYILADLERKCKHIDIVTNTTAFDTLHVGRLLAKEKMQPLYYSRDGRYRWTYHSTSYILGLWGGVIGEMTAEHWTEFDAWVIRKIDSIFPCLAIYTRADPENDAYFIACRWLNANVYAKKRMNKRMLKVEERKKRILRTERRKARLLKKRASRKALLLTCPARKQKRMLSIRAA